MDARAGRGWVNLRPTGTSERSERLDVDVEMLWGLIRSGFEVDGEAVLCERMTWVIYGRTTYDGEIILAEYEDPDDAAHVLRSVAERPGPTVRPSSPTRDRSTS